MRNGGTTSLRKPQPLRIGAIGIVVLVGVEAEYFVENGVFSGAFAEEAMVVYFRNDGKRRC